MALGTPTRLASVGHSASAPTFSETLQLAGDGAYPTGGTLAFSAFVATAVGKESVDVIAVTDCGAFAATTVQYDQVADSLISIVRATGAQVADTTDLSGTTFRICVTYR